MTTRGDTVHLKNWDLWANGAGYLQKKGIDISYKRIDKQNKEAVMTLYGSEKDNIYKEDINNTLAELEKKFILSDRVRTVNNLPRYKIINTVKERIQ